MLRKEKLMIRAIYLAVGAAILLLSGCASAPVSNALPPYPYEYPALSPSADPELSAMVSESGANDLIKYVGRAFACSTAPYKYLDGFRSPQNGAIFTSFYSRNHLAGTCYEIRSITVTKDLKNVFHAEYSFVSHSSGESAKRKMGFIKLNNVWYLKV
jgi:hypothetical protein